MIYDLAQFYHDELANWSGTITKFTEEADAYLKRVAQASEKNKEERLLSNLNIQIDALLTHVGNFDALKMLIFSQRQRLAQFGEQVDSLGKSFRNDQASLRKKIRSTERNFSLTKYMGSVVLFNYLNNG